MTPITLPTSLILALRDEYPGCFPDAESLETFTEQVLWSWLRDRRRTRAVISEHPPVPEEATCAGFGA